MERRRVSPPQLGAIYSQNSGGNCVVWGGDGAELRAASSSAGDEVELRAASGSASCTMVGSGLCDGISVDSLCWAKYPKDQGATAHCDGGLQGWSCVVGGGRRPPEACLSFSIGSARCTTTAGTSPAARTTRRAATTGA